MDSLTSTISRSIRRRVALAFVICTVVVSGVFAQDHSLILNTSHPDRVTAIRYDESTDTVVTAGRDGTVRFWNRDTGNLIRTIRFSDLPITQVVLHPTRPVFAAVESDGTRRHRVTIWNYDTGRPIVERLLDDAPIHLAFSPQGRFLAYSMPRFQSMEFLDATTGRVLPYFRSGHGIVTFFTIAGSEARVMTYIPSSGTIIYRDIPSGNEVQRARTRTNLQHMFVLSDRRHAAAVAGTELIILDILNGSVVDSTRLGRIHSLAVDPVSDEIGVFLEETGRTVYTQYAFSGGRLSLRYTPDRAIPTTPTATRFIRDDIFLGYEAGDIVYFPRFAREKRDFALNRVRPVTAIAYADKNLYMGTPDSVISLESDVFAFTPVRRTDIPHVTYVTDREIDLPFSGSPSLTSVADDRILAWSDATSELFAIDRYGVYPTPVTTNDRITELKPYADSALVTERNGRIRFLDLNTGAAELEVTSIGTSTAVYLDHSVVVGKNATATALDSALLRIDGRTGETITMPTPSFLVFDVEYDIARNQLFTVGLEDRRGSIETVLYMHRGENLNTVRAVTSYPREDLSANIAIDRLTSNVYFAAGRRDIAIWDGLRVRTLPPSGHVPRTVHVLGNLVYALNFDGSVSVWTRETDRHVVNFYLLADGNWAAITAEGYFAASAGVPNSAFTLIPGRRSVRLESLRLFVGS